MSDFKAKMHQIQFRLGLSPRPHWGSLQRSPRPPSWWGGGSLPLPKNPTPALGPAGLDVLAPPPHSYNSLKKALLTAKRVEPIVSIS